jgi:hypothetical protein
MLILKFTQRLSMIGVFGPLNNLFQAPSLGTHKRLKKYISIAQEKYYCNATCDNKFNKLYI